MIKVVKMNQFNQWYARLMSSPRSLLFLVFLLAVFLGLKLPKLQLDASGDSLVLEGDRSLEVYRKVYRDYGAMDFLVITYRPMGDLFAQGTIDQVASLKKELEVLPGVKSVITYLDVPLLYSPKVTLATFSEDVHYLNDGKVDMELARQEFLHSPLYSRLITSESQATTALQVNLVADDELVELRNRRDDLQAIGTRTSEQQLELALVENAYDEARYARTQLERQLVTDIRTILDRYRSDARIFLGGLPMILTDMLEFVKKDMMVFGSIIALFMMMQLFLFFRAARWVILPLLTCMLTCIYMLGGLAWAGIKLTVISANFVALLLVIGLSITLHLVVSFIENEKLHPGLNQQELTLMTMQCMFKPCFYTTTTTMVAFLSFILSDIRLLVDFGWMMTVALAVALVISFIVMPAGLMLLPRRYHEEENNLSRNFTHFFASLADKRGRELAWVSLCFLVFSLSGIVQLKVENRFIDYFDETTEIYQGMLEIDAELGGTLPLDIIINHEEKTFSVSAQQGNADSMAAASENLEDIFGEEVQGEDDFASDTSTPYAMSYWFSRSGMEEIRQIHDFLQGIEETGKVLSLATLYAVMKDITGGSVDDVQLALIKENLSPEIDKALVRPYLSADGKQARIYARVKETSRTLNRSEMLKKIDRFMTEEMGYRNEQYEITGMMVLYNNMLQSLFFSQIATIGAVFLSIMLMIAFLFRSFSLSLLAILPNMLAALFVLGTMGWFGIPLDMMTITIAAITVGIGVDDTIHYVHRFRLEFAKDRDYVATMYRCHSSIGLAMFYTSLTITVGFSILMLSNFTPSFYFGLLTALAMSSAFLGAQLLLPLLINTCKPLGPEAGQG